MTAIKPNVIVWYKRTTNYYIHMYINIKRNNTKHLMERKKNKHVTRIKTEKGKKTICGKKSTCEKN